MKIKHKMRGHKVLSVGHFLFSLASSCYSGQTDRPNLTNWGKVAHLKPDLPLVPLSTGLRESTFPLVTLTLVLGDA